VNHLKKFFENYKATQIVTSRINEYVEIRLEEEAANATINRELAALKRMLNMGAKQTPPLVDRVRQSSTGNGKGENGGESYAPMFSPAGMERTE
jgi:hypothetical protein